MQKHPIDISIPILGLASRSFKQYSVGLCLIAVNKFRHDSRQKISSIRESESYEHRTSMKRSPYTPKYQTSITINIVIVIRSLTANIVNERSVCYIEPNKQVRASLSHTTHNQE